MKMLSTFKMLQIEISLDVIDTPYVGKSIFETVTDVLRSNKLKNKPTDKRTIEQKTTTTTKD